MNNNNILNLRKGSFGRIVNLVEVGEVFIPTLRRLANARILEVDGDGSVSVHWNSNFNLNGDFSSELIRFDSDLKLDKGDLEERNTVRVKNGLMRIDK